MLSNAGMCRSNAVPSCAELSEASACLPPSTAACRLSAVAHGPAVLLSLLATYYMCTIVDQQLLNTAELLLMLTTQLQLKLAAPHTALHAPHWPLLAPVRSGFMAPTHLLHLTRPVVPTRMHELGAQYLEQLYRLSGSDACSSARPNPAEAAGVGRTGQQTAAKSLSVT
jgi:hypothetical protein